MISSPNHGVIGVPSPIFVDQRIEDCALLDMFGALKFIKSSLRLIELLFT
jgi:hypothetical protein